MLKTGIMEINMQPTKIEISHKTIIFTVIFLVLLWFLYQIRQLVLFIFISLLLTFVLEPAVEAIEKLKIPRVLAIILIYLFLFSIIGIVLAGVVPPLIDQTSVLISRLPTFLQQVGFSKIDQNVINNQISQLGSIPVNLVKFIIGIFSNIATVLILAVFTFYFLQERKKLDDYLAKYFTKEERARIKKVITKIEKRLGNWIRGALTLMTVVGVSSYFGFRLLGIEFALPLAILSGLLEIIPNIGPTMAAVPAVIAGLSISSVHGLATLSWCFLVQQIENNFIVPKVMQKTAGVSPLVTLISLGVGFRVAGIAGAVLAVPIVLTLEVIVSEFLSPELRKP